MNPSAVRPAPPRPGDASPAAKICPRCRRANPAEAAYCYFDGGNLVGQQEGGQKLPSDFLFPSGRRARTLEDLANACQDEWATARDFLQYGALHAFFVSIGRHDLARVAHEGSQGSNPDIELTRFLDSLPVTRSNVPKLDLQPRRFFLGRIPTDGGRELELVLSNPGKGTLQGTVSVSEGADWLMLVGGGAVQVVAGREQRLKLKLDVKKLQASQNYAGQLRVVTSGGIVEVPVRFELVARPFARPPFQGVRTPRELAEKMRAQPKQAGPLLESGDIERWFAGNNWPYPGERADREGDRRGPAVLRGDGPVEAAEADAVAARGPLHGPISRSGAVPGRAVDGLEEMGLRRRPQRSRLAQGADAEGHRPAVGEHLAGGRSVADDEVPAAGRDRLGAGERRPESSPEGRARRRGSAAAGDQEPLATGVRVPGALLAAARAAGAGGRFRDGDHGRGGRGEARRCAVGSGDVAVAVGVAAGGVRRAAAGDRARSSRDDPRRRRPGWPAISAGTSSLSSCARSWPGPGSRSP